MIDAGTLPFGAAGRARRAAVVAAAVVVAATTAAATAVPDINASAAATSSAAAVTTSAATAATSSATTAATSSATAAATSSATTAATSSAATAATSNATAANPEAPESRQIARRMIEAHGGMTTWRSAPTVSFEDTWDGQPMSRTVVEQGSRRAYIEVPASGARLGWDGERAWSENWTGPAPPRFLALLNYYFANLPWLTEDPGVVLGAPGRATIAGDPTSYVTIRMAFEPGTGDTPDDYYLLYVHPESYRLHACEYIVTYESLLPPGTKATPPHLLIYDAWTTVDGLTVPAHFTIYDGGAVYAACRFENWSLRAPFDAARMQMPAGATLDTSKP